MRTQQRVACRFRLCDTLTIWPLHLETAQYFAAPRPAAGARAGILPGVDGGAATGLPSRVRQKLSDDKPGVTPAGAPVSELPIDELPIHLVGTEVDSVALYEQLFANCTRVYAALSR